MDLGKIIEEIVPWVVLLGMFLPYLKKVRRAQNIAAAKQQDQASAPVAVQPLHQAGPARQWKGDARRKSRTVLPRTLSPESTGTAPLTAAVLSDEGIRTTEDKSPMHKPVSGGRVGARRRDIRRALIWNEILNRKY